MDLDEYDRLDINQPGYHEFTPTRTWDPGGRYEELYVPSGWDGPFATVEEAQESYTKTHHILYARIMRNRSRIGGSCRC